MRIVAVYHVRSDAAAIAARAQAIALEQSIEAPLAAVRDDFVAREIVGEVAAIREIAAGVFEVEIGLAAASVGGDAGQLLNMLFGNSSLQSDVELADFRLPDAGAFPGPGQGIAGLRARAGAATRALTCVAVKPQGLPAERLAELVEAFALGGVDFIKDDHGLADQAYSPFAARIAACAAAARRAAETTGRLAGYIPSLSGHYGTMRRQIELLRAAGLGAVMFAPMIAGLATAQALGGREPRSRLLRAPDDGRRRAHRRAGADAAVSAGRRRRRHISQPRRPLRLLARDLPAPSRRGCDEPWGTLKDAAPAPAGGMTLARVPEMLDFYGRDTMLLIGGALLAAPPDRLTAETAAFVRAVAEHGASR